MTSSDTPPDDECQAQESYCGLFIVTAYLRLWQLMPDHPLFRLGLPHRDADRGHVRPGQARPRLVPAERLHILARVRGESCANETIFTVFQWLHNQERLPW